MRRPPIPSPHRLVALAAGLCAAAAGPATAAPDTPEAAAVEASDALAGDHDYYVVAQRVSDFAALLSRDTGTRILLSPKVRGRIEGVRLTGSLGEILDALAAARGLDWFEYNGAVHVSTRDETATRLVRLGDLPAAAARAELERMGLPMERFAVREAASGTAIALSGPPGLLGLAEAAIESMPSPAASPRPAGASVRVLRGGAESIEPVSSGGGAEVLVVEGTRDGGTEATE